MSDYKEIFYDRVLRDKEADYCRECGNKLEYGETEFVGKIRKCCFNKAMKEIVINATGSEKGAHNNLMTYEGKPFNPCDTYRADLIQEYKQIINKAMKALGECTKYTPFQAGVYEELFALSRQIIEMEKHVKS